MTIVFALLLAVAGFAYVTYPLLKPRLDAVDSGEDAQADELGVKKDTTYSMIKELEFDYQSGILSEEDYRDLEARYKKKAISLLKEADRSVKFSPEDDDIEREVRRLRQGKPADADDEIERQVRRLRQTGPANVERAERQAQRNFCAQCGAKVKQADRFCASCGAHLT
ncbi:MAG: zinc ribbon domain-containing protein [Chloroflexi bacterium]|nr:zinc ribbon domain-containing protein [Chloroflexota bacterium]